MSKRKTIMVLCEGHSEQNFVKSILGPYLGYRNIDLYPSLLSKRGQKGGNVSFERTINDIKKFLRQRKDIYVTLIVDYYGLDSAWPGYRESISLPTSAAKFDKLKTSTLAHTQNIDAHRATERFIPYFSMHELESLYFSHPLILSRLLNVNQATVDAVLHECGVPENINNHPATAPSKRLEKLSPTFKKTTTGIEIARQIGVEIMQEKCPLFGAWVDTLTRLPLL